MSFSKNSSAGYLVNHLSRLFAKGLQGRIVPYGIVVGQFPILLELWEKDGVTQRTLLSKLDIEQATLANTLTRMERDGLIKRKKHPSDARSQLIWLTGKAHLLKSAAHQAATAQNAAVLSVLSKTEQEQFLDLMQKMIAAARDG